MLSSIRIIFDGEREDLRLIMMMVFVFLRFNINNITEICLISVVICVSVCLSYKTKLNRLLDIFNCYLYMKIIILYPYQIKGYRVHMDKLNPKSRSNSVTIHT